MQMFHNNTEQREALLGIIRDLGSKLIALTFPDPSTDHQVIRHQAYLRGQFDMAKAILEDDFEAPELPNKSQE